VIQRIPNWSWDPRAGGITMTPPGGGAVIQYRERVRPLQTVASILRDRDRRFQVTSIGPIERHVTGEGEYAAVVDVAGVLDVPTGGGRGRPLARSLGFIFGDDWYSEVVGIALQPDMVGPVGQWVRKLVAQSKLMLGIRRRRCVYTPPEGWSGYSRLPLFMTWFPPDYPRDPTSITVYPALPAPVGVTAPASFEMLTIGAPSAAELLGEIVDTTPVQFGAATGSMYELAIRDERNRMMVRTMAVLRDDRYVYASYLDRFAATAGPSDEGLARYRALLASFEPLPAASASNTSSLALSADWF